MTNQEETNELIMGKNAVFEALASGRELNKIWVNEGLQKKVFDELVRKTKPTKIIIQTVPRKKLDQLANGENHQGIIASVAAYEYATLDQVFEKAAQAKQDPFIILLDELEDPHNLGSILRTADAVGAHGVIIPKRRSVNLTATVARASTGAIEYIPVVRVNNLSQTIDELKERGVWIAGTDAKAKLDYRQMDATLPLGVVIGSEGKGISKKILERCDFLYQMPMVGKVTSLNASVAAALLMYEVYRHRHPLME